MIWNHEREKQEKTYKKSIKNKTICASRITMMKLKWNNFKNRLKLSSVYIQIDWRLPINSIRLSPKMGNHFTFVRTCEGHKGELCIFCKFIFFFKFMVALCVINEWRYILKHCVLFIEMRYALCWTFFSSIIQLSIIYMRLYIFSSVCSVDWNIVHEMYAI